MNRTDVEKYIADEYVIVPEYLWKDDHVTAALRHASHKKWFGILMRISARRLGLDSDAMLDIMNVKLDPDFIQVLLRDKAGQVFPAYHMNKKHWITLVLNEQSDAKLIQALIHDSFANTL